MSVFLCVCVHSGAGGKGLRFDYILQQDSICVELHGRNGRALDIVGVSEEDIAILGVIHAPHHKVYFFIPLRRVISPLWVPLV